MRSSRFYLSIFKEYDSPIIADVIGRLVNRLWSDSILLVYGKPKVGKGPRLVVSRGAAFSENKRVIRRRRQRQGLVCIVNDPVQDRGLFPPDESGRSRHNPPLSELVRQLFRSILAGSLLRMRLDGLSPACRKIEKQMNQIAHSHKGPNPLCPNENRRP